MFTNITAQNVLSSIHVYILSMNQLTFGRPTVLLISLLRARYQEESVGRPTGRSIVEGPVQSVA